MTRMAPGPYACLAVRTGEPWLLMDRTAAEHTLVHAFHFPFPSLGYVERRGAGWQWLPLATASAGPAAAPPAASART
jgi:hypothetical protein